MNFESFSQPQNEQEIKKPLSADYDNIRKETVKLIGQRILLLEDMSKESPEKALLEEAASKLQDPQFASIIFEELSGELERLRNNSEDLEYTDEKVLPPRILEKVLYKIRH